MDAYSVKLRELVLDAYRQGLKTKAIAERFKVTTGPVPAAGHFDIFDYLDAAFGARKVQAVEWSLPLDGSDMTWTWEAVQ